MWLICPVFHTKAQSLRCIVAQALAQTLQNPSLHEVELLRPNGVRADHGDRPGALRDRSRGGSHALTDNLRPNGLQRCELRLRSRPVQGRAERGGGGTRCSTATHAATAWAASKGSRSERSSARGGTDSSDAAVISACPPVPSRATNRLRRSGS